MIGPLAKKLVAIALAAAGLAVYSVAGPVFHVEKVEVEGDSWAVSESDVRAGLAQSGEMSLLLGDFEKLSDKVAANVLVRDATVTLDYPGIVRLQVFAREPYARSADGGLIDSNGEWYQSETKKELPIFAMPRALMPEAIVFFSDAMETLEGHGFGITQLHHDWDGWRIFLDNGWVVLLGENKKRQRLDRFAAALPDLRAILNEKGGIRFDMRYPHGMAVAGWTEQYSRGDENG